MKFLKELLSETRQERIDQHNKANKLRKLYNKRKDVKLMRDTELAKGNDEDTIEQLEKELSDLDREIEQLEKSVNESTEVGGQIPHLIARALIDGSIDIYDIMNNPNNPAERDASRVLHDMYNQVASEYHLHPDDDFEEIQDRMYDRIERDYAGIAESHHDQQMLAALTPALKKALSKKAELEDDLRSLKSAARTEREFDAVEDFEARVDRHRRLVDRLKRRIEIRKSAIEDTKGDK